MADRSGFRLGSIAGVPILLAPSWLLVAGLVTVLFAPVVADRLPEIGSARYLVAFAFAVLLYASVLVHELGHSLVALNYGLTVRRITLHALGGVSEIEEEAPTPGREFAIAAAGPALSLLLGALGLTLLRVLDVPPVVEVLLLQLTVANFLVGVFNLLPGLPLDGGRVLRAGIWAVTGHSESATVIASNAGRVTAGLVLLIPFLLAAATGNPPSIVGVVWAVLIATFIWQGATDAQRSSLVRQRLPGLRAATLARRATTVSGDVSVAEAVRRASLSQSGAVVVVDAAERPVGIVQEAAVQAVPPQRRPWVPVRDLARSLVDVPPIRDDLTGEDLLAAFDGTPAGDRLVLSADGAVYGVINTGDLERALGLRQPGR
jgi:Zn-dependent protease